MNEQQKPASDHDLLTRIDERTERIDDRLAEHLRRHWAITVVAIGALFTSVSGLIVFLISLRAGV